MDHNDFILGNRIRDWRREFDVTQEELANAVGVSRQSIISLESGKCLPSVPLALSISHFFDFPLEQLFIVEFESESNQKEEVSVDRNIRPFHNIFDSSSANGERKLETDASLLLDRQLDLRVEEETPTDRSWEFHRMIEESMTPMHRVFDTNLVPQMNVYQTENNIVVEADVPGMTEDNVDIEIRDGVLTIKGERKEETEEKQKEYFHREVSYGAFQRAVTLPTEVQPAKAAATVTNGQLKIVLPKAEPEQAKVHKLKAKKA